MSKALTNSLALLQEIKNQLAAGEATDRSKERLNTLLDRRGSSPGKETRITQRPFRHVEPRQPSLEYSSKGSIRANNARPSSNRLYDYLKEIKLREEQQQQELQRSVSEQFDAFIARMTRRRGSDSPS